MTPERQKLLALEIRDALNTLQMRAQSLALRQHAEAVELTTTQQGDYVLAVAAQIESMAQITPEKVLALFTSRGIPEGELKVPYREEHLAAFDALRARHRQEGMALTNGYLEEVLDPIIERFFPEVKDV